MRAALVAAIVMAIMDKPFGDIALLATAILNIYRLFKAEAKAETEKSKRKEVEKRFNLYKERKE